MSISVTAIQKGPHPEYKSAVQVEDRGSLTFNNVNFVSKNRGITTEGINTCVALELNSGDSNVLLHLAPEQVSKSSIKKIIPRISNDIFERGKEPITAFIIGGREFNQNSTNAIRSYELANEIAFEIEKQKIPFSFIFGKKENAPRDGIYVVNKNITIWNKLFEQLKLSDKPSSFEVENALKQIYQFVEIAKEAPVQFAKKFIESKQNFKLGNKFRV